MLLKKFWRSKSGNFALLLGIGLPAILSAVAFAADVSTIMRAKSNLQNALDAANLASSHLGDLDITRTDAFNRYFQANVAGHGELTNARATLTVDRGVNFVKTKAVASADVDLNFAFLLGESRHIVVDASAVRSNNQLEVVLVLDNTGSMAGAKIAALKTATDNLLKYLEAAQSPTRKVRVALVPFVTAVNVNGDGFDPSWIDMDGKSSTNGINFPVINDKRPNHMALFRQLMKDPAAAAKLTGWKDGKGRIRVGKAASRRGLVSLISPIRRLIHVTPTLCSCRISRRTVRERGRDLPAAIQTMPITTTIRLSTTPLMRPNLLGMAD